MATGRDDLVDDLLKRVIYETDNAIAGEAAGIATGLIRVGHGSAECIGEMLQFAHDTKHEKIVRGIAMGVALSMLGKEEEADALAEQARARESILSTRKHNRIFSKSFYIFNCT